VKVVTFMNSKGGVAKTTLAVTLAAGLAIQGKKVMLVDTDSQEYTATPALGIAKEPGFYNMLVRGASWAHVAREVSPDRYCTADQTQLGGALWLLPSNIEGRNVVTSGIEDSLLLHTRLQELQGRFDYVILDTAPTPSLINALIYQASDWMIYPTQLEFPSVEGLKGSFEYRKRYSRLRLAYGLPPIEALGIVPTMTNLGTNEHAFNMGDIKNNPDQLPIWRPISRRIIWAEAARDQRAIFAYAPDHEAAQEGWKLVSQFNEAAQRLEESVV
jgi:chromosome partitioning protein